MVLGTLEEWHAYASKVLPGITAAFDQLRTQKSRVLADARRAANANLRAPKQEVADLRAEVDSIAALLRREAKARGARPDPAALKEVAELRDEVNAREAALAAREAIVREQAGGAYYEAANADLRREHKRVHQQQVHLESTQTEAKSVWEAVKGASANPAALARFRLLKRGGRLHAVMELIGTDFIANIVADPRNIVPESQADQPASGVAKALIGLVILENKRAAQGGAWRDIRLYALTNKVKGIYDRYGFRAYSGPRAQPVELAEHQRGVKAHDPTTQQRGKVRADPWYTTGTMQMTEARADAFLAHQNLPAVLDVPTDLKALLPPK